MSHFTVLVIGENPEEQLAPYHEYECTGIEDEYVIDVDVTEELKEDYKKYGVEYENIEKFAEEWNGAIKKEYGRFYEKTNPNAKWDWYSLGGRWNGFFQTKRRLRWQFWRTWVYDKPMQVRIRRSVLKERY